MASRTLKVEIIGDASSLRRALGQAETTTSKFGRVAKTALIGVGTAGVAALGAAGVASVKMAIDFDASLNKIGALVGASAKQLKQYRESVLELAGQTAKAPKELADALYFITSAGFEGAKALKVLRSSALASAAGLGETATVADAVTSAVNAYGEKALSAAKATDILLATVREGKAEPEELAAAIGRVIAPAENLGVTFEEVGGALAGLSLTGLDAAEAVTGLRGIFTALIKPSEKAKALLEDVGLSVKEIREQIDKKGLLATLQSLRDRFDGNKEALAKLFPEVRGLNAVLSLTGRNAEKNAEVMKSVQQASGDTAKAFAEASQSAQFQLNRAWAKIQVFMIRFGSVVLPLVVRAAEKVGPVFDRLSEFLDELRKQWQNFNGVLRRNQDTVNKISAVLGALAKAVGFLITMNIKLQVTLIRVWIKIASIVLTVTDKIIGAIQKVIGWARTLGGVFRSVWSAMGTAVRIVFAPLLTVISYLQRAYDIASKVLSILPSIGNSNPSPGPGSSGGRTGHQQSGGLVQRGRAYVVGERRPELFVPNVSGRILPRVPQGNVVNNYFSFPNYVGDKRELESLLRDVVTKYARANGGRLAF